MGGCGTLLCEGLSTCRHLAAPESPSPGFAGFAPSSAPSPLASRSDSRADWLPKHTAITDERGWGHEHTHTHTQSGLTEDKGVHLFQLCREAWQVHAHLPHLSSDSFVFLSFSIFFCLTRLFREVSLAEKKSNTLLLADKNTHTHTYRGPHTPIIEKLRLGPRLFALYIQTYLSEAAAGPLDGGGMRVLQQLHGVVHSWKGRQGDTMSQAAPVCCSNIP